jgi:hypothetical protein
LDGRSILGIEGEALEDVNAETLVCASSLISGELFAFIEVASSAAQMQHQAQPLQSKF